MYATLTLHGLRTHDGVPTLEQMQDAVDGYIETALRIPSSRDGITIDFFCNDTGLLDGLPFLFTRTTDGQPIAGNLIAAGGEVETGETVALVDADFPLIVRAFRPFTPEDLP